MTLAAKQNSAWLLLTVFDRHIRLSQQRLESGYDLFELRPQTTVHACRKAGDEHALSDRDSW